jgi:hypothetical protein
MRLLETGAWRGAVVLPAAAGSRRRRLPQTRASDYVIRFLRRVAERLP